MPYFSIVIPLYNKEQHIKKTLQSVLQQSYIDFEVIVVNDGSNDNSKAVVESITDDRITLYNIENSGPSHARNFGVSKSASTLIVFLDADDYWEPHHLEDLKNLHKSFPNCGLYAKAYDYLTNDTIVKGIFKNIVDGWSGVLQNYFESSMNNGIASCSSVMIPRDIFEQLKGFNTNYDSGEDTDLWIRLALQFPIAFHHKSSVTINWDQPNRLSNISMKSKKHFDLDAFSEIELKNDSLKKYLDLNRLSLAFQYKMAGFTKESSVLINAIDSNNISTTQKLLLSFPSWLLKSLLKIRNKLRQMNIDFRLFK